MPLNVPWPDAVQWMSEADVKTAITEQAHELNQTLGETPLLVLTVLHGGLVYAGHLLPQLNMPVELDCVRVTRYRNTTSGGETLDWKLLPSAELAGQTVLLLDDIFDEGKTLKALVQWAEGAGAERVYSAVMLDKAHARKATEYTPDSSALTVPDHYVFGMGMDYQGAWRNASGIWYLTGNDA